MANPNEYLVFEADQVLTNDSLNQMFYYLDQQNRWTRNKLIGIGIVCGLEIALNPGVIEVTKGVGVTSQGYLIIISNPKQCTYYIPYSPIDTPNDLPFTYPGDLPFYKPFCSGKNIYLLLSDNEYDALETDKQKQALTISSAPDKFFDDYVVVLFLEANEMDLKNCDAFDCNNKGEKIVLQVRPLLVKKTDLPGIATNTGNNGNQVAANAPIVALKRYNVPYTSLQTSDDVLNAFVSLVDDTTLSAVANAYIFCYTNYSYLLNNPSDFSTLFNDLKNFRTTILDKNPLFIQYFYDFIDDLIKAYKEFTFKITGMMSACCPDENIFPLHLVLGEASANSTSSIHDSYRTYFIYSPLFSKQGNSVNQTAFLYNRMELLVKEFTILFQNYFRESARQSVIKITPSQYEFHWLSERAIPYYYNVNDSGNELYQSWNYYKSSHGIADYNLGYNANLYSTADIVIQPLLYDIERFNFFRIEGHIGQNYAAVLKNILGQRLSYNLPFDVVAISADELPTDSANLPECNIIDLETDYKLILSELACKIHTPFCMVTKFPYPYARLSADKVKIAAQENTVDALKAETAQNISVSLAALAAAYTKGDFMRKYCKPNDGTVGSFYLNSLSSDAGFTNPIQQVNTKDLNSLLYYNIFNFVDAVENLMQVVMTASIASLDINKFTTSYNLAKTSASLLSILIAEHYENAITGDSIAEWLKDLEIDLIAEEFTLFIYSCIDERLQTLKEEYNRRLQLYELQRSFLYYYRKHPGLEHKAGVPKGGTFVLVYHPASRSRITIAGTNLNQNINTVDTKIQDIALNNNTIKLIRSFVDDCNDAPPDKKKNIIDILTFLQQPKPKYSIADNAVIADFYIPYLCCSDCSPVAYVIPEPPPAPDKPTLKMGTTFCDSDKTQPIEVSPTGGTFADNQGNKIKGLDEAGLTFTPSVAGPGVYTIIYTINGVASDPVIVTVLLTPKDSNFSFDSKPQGNLNFTATFKPEITDANSYTWAFGPGFNPQSSTDQSPVIAVTVIPTGGETQTFATLTVSNGNCQAAPVRKELRISPNGVYEPSAIKTNGSTTVQAKAEVKKAPAKATTGKLKKESTKKKSNDKK